MCKTFETLEKVKTPIGIGKIVNPSESEIVLLNLDSNTVLIEFEEGHRLPFPLKSLEKINDIGFKVGDEVEVTGTQYKGKKGVIIDYTMSEKWWRVKVFGEENEFYQFCEADLKPLTPTPFTKDDLKDGDIVTLGNGNKRIAFEGKLLRGNSIPIKIKSYDENLLLSIDEDYKHYAITLVKRNGQVVYERPKEFSYKGKIKCKFSDGIDDIKIEGTKKEELIMDLKQIGETIEKEDSVISINIEVSSCNTN